MSQSNKPGFFRPVEIRTGVNDTIIFKKSGGANRTVTINTGTYSSIMAVCEAWNTAVAASLFFTGDGVTTLIAPAFGTGSMGLGYQSVYTVITFSSSSNIYFQNDTTRELFGYESDPSIGTAFESPYQMGYCWVPKYQTATQSRFQLRQKDLYSGMQVKSGGLAGVETGPDIQYLDCKFVNEAAENIMESACTSANTINKTSEYFFSHVRSAAPATSGNARMNGFFYMPNLSDNIAGIYDAFTTVPGGSDGTTYTYEGIHFDYSSSPDLYAWCSIAKEGVAMAAPSAPTGKAYCGIDFTVNIDTDVPDFEAPDQVS